MYSYSSINLDVIEEALRGIFMRREEYPEERRARLYTGVGGMELFDECFEKDCGWGRIYVKKIPRILLHLKGWRISRTGKQYKKILL